MILALLVFLGGVMTILSPCILPVLPFVFARAQQPFLKTGLPMLAGMAFTFAGIATLAAVGGAWAIRVNQYGRLFALVLLAMFALTLLSSRLADLLARPFVALGNRLLQQGAASDDKVSVVKSMLFGSAVGLLWAPCAGPILGLILTGAAISGPNTETTLLLFAYAAGAATSLAIALLAGARLFARLKKTLGAGQWVRRGLGMLVLLCVIVIAFGWDTRLFASLSITSTNRLEQALINKIRPQPAFTNTLLNDLRVEGQLPSLGAASAWLNSAPITKESLRGKVVLIDFWTYSCINCLRALPYVRAWHEKYKKYGLVVIGVHTPEFAFEKELDNVRRAVKDLGVSYPVALDNRYVIWRLFNNQYWPAHYFIDAKGDIRGHHFGEGNYNQSEAIIRQLLTEAGARDLPAIDVGAVGAIGVEAAADKTNIRSPETYLGYGRAENFVSASKLAQDRSEMYQLPSKLNLNQWGLAGAWKATEEKIVLTDAPGKIVFRFYARDLHLVLGPSVDGKPVRFRVLLDGVAPALNHGLDVDENGVGIIREQRLYQLIRQKNDIGERTFSIEFLDGGVQAFAFTFG